MLDKDVQLEALSVLAGIPIKQALKNSSTDEAPLMTVGDFFNHTILGNWGLESKQSDNSSQGVWAWVKSLVNPFYGAVKKEFFVDMDEFFDPEYDFDFRNLSDTQVKCMRSDDQYNRPRGWYRMALKVRDKYPGGNTWLGPNGWREDSAPGEWPVSYHGTSVGGAKGIVVSHYKAGPRAVYGRGIYSTPFLRIADGYAKSFTSEKTGKKYKVVMQNRINPKEREVCRDKDYWLIPVPEGTSARHEKEIVEKSIRPYGILIQEVTSVTQMRDS